MTFFNLSLKANYKSSNNPIFSIVEYLSFSISGIIFILKYFEGLGNFIAFI
jgi:hypothetical protein